MFSRGIFLVLAVASLTSAKKQEVSQVGVSTNRQSNNLPAALFASSADDNGLEHFELKDTVHRALNETEEEGHDDHEEEGHDDHEEEEGHDDHEEEEGHEEELPSDKKKKPWGAVILASLLINMATLAGLVIILFGMVGKAVLGDKKDENTPPSFDWKLTHNVIPSFACGALLATAVFLILPEAFHMIESGVNHRLGVEEAGHDEHRRLARFLQDMANATMSNTTTTEEEDHHEEEEGHSEEEEEHIDTEVPIAWRLGCSILGGFLIPVVSSLIFPHYHEEDMTSSPPQKELKSEEPSEEDETSTPAGEVEEPTKAVVAEPASPAINYALMSSILVGDFFHNFTDGVIVGASFSLCTRDLAISVTAATLYHELAQEVGDFFMLTKHCHLSTPVALLCNFCGGLSVLLGAILILLLDISNLSIGCILAMGAGVYLYIGAVECFPRAKLAQKSQTDTLIGLGAFVCGVVPIGLVLINHGHCTDEH